MLARSRPIIGSRNEIWCTMKPTCAIISIANGTVMVQNERLRNAARRICAMDRATGGDSVANASAGGSARLGGWPTQIRMAGTAITTITSAAPINVAENPNLPMAPTRRGTPKTPPQLAPLSARLMAMPRRLSNHNPSVLLIAARLVPAQPNAIRT